MTGRLPRRDLSPFSTEIRDFVNATCDRWPKQDPDGRQIRIDGPGVAEKVDGIIRVSPEITLVDLEQAVDRYIDPSIPRQRYKAPQYFFDENGPWVGIVRAQITARSTQPVSASEASKREVRRSTSNRLLQTWTAGELLDLPPVEPRWCWEGLVPRARVGMITAASDVGKTALALQLGVAIATGRSLFGQETVPGGAGVLLVSFEDDAAEDLGPRLRLVIGGMPDLSPREMDALRRNLRVANPTWAGPDVLFEGLRGELEAELEAMRKDGVVPALLVVETLAAVTEGDENSPQATRALWNTARAIAKLQDTTVIVSHHHRKETGTGKGRADLFERLSTDQSRGSTANPGASRFVLQLATLRPDEAKEVGLDEIKALNNGFVVFRSSKLKALKLAPMVLERVNPGEPGAHCWAVRPDGDALLAALLKCREMATSLTQAEAVLVALWNQRQHPDRDAIRREAFPDQDASKGGTAFKNALQHLRSHGWLQKDRGSLALTMPGAEEAQRIAARMVPSEAVDAALAVISEDA